MKNKIEAVDIDLVVHGRKSAENTSPYVPVEEKNTLRAQTEAFIVDVLCEGEIEGPANGGGDWTSEDDWKKSAAFNEVHVKQSDGTDNFTAEGISISARIGSTVQNYMPNFSEISSATNVNVQLKEEDEPTIRTITNSDVDHCRVTISIPALTEQKDNGDLVETTVKITITIIPDDGAGTPWLAVSATDDSPGIIKGKCTAEYRRQYNIKNLAATGPAPWQIKVERITEDSEELKLQNKTYWLSYTEVIDTKLMYSDRAVVGVRLTSKDFGASAPKRYYKIKGRKIKYPDNYHPQAEPPTYDGVWGGDFTTGYCSNPAWVMYDLLTDPIVGLGDRIDEDMVDKWTLDAIGRYCDEQVPWGFKTRQDDGTYTTSSGFQNRFTFNGPISTRAEAIQVITHMSSVFGGFPIWATGQVSFVQDKPTTPTRIANKANVIGGLFEYEGSPKRQRHTVVRVTWNNPDNFSKSEVVEVVDEAGIDRYGYNETQIQAFGCNNKAEAVRRGKYILYTDINQTDTVKFQGGLEWADCLPGENVDIMDADWASVDNFHGRIVSGTTTSITVDRDVVIEGGKTYTLHVQQPNDNSAEKELTNSPETTKTLTWAGALEEAPAAEAAWVMESDALSVRTFKIVQVKETETGIYELQGILYDVNKWASIEGGQAIVETAPTSLLPSGFLDPPSNIDLMNYSYVEGDLDNRNYGSLISWVHSPDARTMTYELRAKQENDAWKVLGKTSENSFDWRPVSAGVYDVAVRGRGIGLESTWLVKNDWTFITSVSGVLPPTGLQVKGGGTEWSGADCTVEWTSTSGSYYEDDIIGDSNLKGYQVYVAKTNDTPLRDWFVPKGTDEATYPYDFNNEDNEGSPQRALKWNVYSVDVYGELSASADTDVFTNTAPDMSAAKAEITNRPTYLRIEWNSPSDIDLDYYKVYCDTSGTPTTVLYNIKHPATEIEIFGLTPGIDYYVQIEPYDGFGAGDKTIVEFGTPTTISGLDISAELVNSITMTDKEGTSAEDLAKLYDYNHSSDGVSYSVSGTETWVDYEYTLTTYFDRMGIWMSNANADVYIGYSEDTGDTWNYLKAEGDHTLDDDNAMLLATDKADAETNYLSLDAGMTICIFPDNLTADKIRLYLTNGSYSTTIYEFVPARLLLAELAAIQHLSAISADIGTILAGNLQSSNYGTDEGMNIDLDAKVIYMGGYESPVFAYDDDTKTINCTGTFVFQSGSTGIADTDAGALALLDNADWSADVTGTEKPADFATYNLGGNLLDNYSITERVDGLTALGDVSLVTGTKDGVSVRVLRSITDGDEEIEHPVVEVDPNSLYEVKLSIKDDGDGVGMRLFGMFAYDKDSNLLTGARYHATGRYWASETDSMIFWNGDAHATWRDVVNYILPHDILDEEDPRIPPGKNAKYFWRMPADTKYVLIRYLSSYNAGTTVTTDFYSPSLRAIAGSNTQWTNWRSGSDVTKIDGGELYVGSHIILNEGGRATFGDQNVVIDTAGDHGNIVVAPDGGPNTQDYVEIDESSVTSYYYNGSGHDEYASLNRIETGVAANNTWVYIPGLFRSQPTISLWQHSLASYDQRYKNQSQSIRIQITDMTEYAENRYKFIARGDLILDSGSASKPVGDTKYESSDAHKSYSDFNSATYYPQGNTRRIYVSASTQSYTYHTKRFGGGKDAAARYRTYWERGWQRMRLFYHDTEYGWRQIYTDFVKTKASDVFDYTFDTSNVIGFISEFYVKHQTTPLTEDSYAITNVNSGVGTKQYIRINSYSSDLGGTSIIATGDIGWMAIGT